MIYDPERALWVPGRRRFLFLAGAAALAPFLRVAPPVVDSYTDSYSHGFGRVIDAVNDLVRALEGIPIPAGRVVAVSRGGVFLPPHEWPAFVFEAEKP